MGFSHGRKRPKLPEYTDTGLSTLTRDQAGRMVNADGTYNVRRSGMRLKDRFSFYHALTTMPWWKFGVTVLVSFLAINVVFAGLYTMIGLEGLTGIQASTLWGRFAEVFFFSAQTITTVGYGHVSPTGVAIGLLASFESLLGLMIFAVATGIFYGRFSGPVAKLIYSREMLIAPYKQGTAVMFRIANAKANSLNDLECQLILSWIEKQDGGGEIRRYYALPLEREKINSLALSWTVVHPIDEESPLWGYTEEQFSRMDAEFIVVLKGYDETSHQKLISRTGYHAQNLKWGAKFRPMFDRTPDSRHTVLHLDRISDYDDVALPTLPQQDLLNTTGNGLPSTVSEN